MDIHVTFHGIEHSAALEAFVREQASKLEHFYDRIGGCRVAVERSEARRGGPYRVRIVIHVPKDEIVVNRRAGLHATPPSDEDGSAKAEDLDGPYKDVYFAVSDAFRSATRRLEDYARRHQGKVKTHEPKENEMATPCAHELCYCDSDAIGGYCSEACRDQGVSPGSDFRCRCGHADCREEVGQGDDEGREAAKTVYGG